MSPGFYKKCWKIVKSEIIQIVRRFFETGEIDTELKNTNIALIPKKQQPVFMTDLHLISLCNVVYKIISKMLVNRLNQIIDPIISDTQSAFIPGRLIPDNIMVGFEVMHYMEMKSSGKDSWMALKLDMYKAYDRVESRFLEVVLSKMGFENKFTQLFMKCMSSVR